MGSFYFYAENATEPIKKPVDLMSLTRLKYVRSTYKSKFYFYYWHEQLKADILQEDQHQEIFGVNETQSLHTRTLNPTKQCLEKLSAERDTEFKE